MTFLSNPTPIAKKKPLKCPVHEEVIHMPQTDTVVFATTWMTVRVFLAVMAITICATLMALTMGLFMYWCYVQPTLATRYTRFCTIPIKIKDSAYYSPKHNVMPVRWSSSPEHNAQVLSAAPEDLSDDVVATLREQFDIGDSVEKISVMDNGRQVSFIHDFDANLTGIVDADRCFTMELDPSVVVSPEVLVLSISRGSPFDVSRVRAALRATLPRGRDATLPLRVPRDLLDHCRNKPTYELRKEDGIIIRKRSADFPSHDYIAFSGRHVQEIEITNLAELLQHEQDSRTLHALR